MSTTGLTEADVQAYLAEMQRLETAPLTDRIDALLPQTQCGKCQTPGCRPYAEAIASGEAINRCVPGGERVIAELAKLTGRSVEPLDKTYGTPPDVQPVAFIREAECIGCTKCIQACPVDAIVGASRLMHTVITDACTGCELCVAPCPVDCIDMIAAPPLTTVGRRIPLLDADSLEENATRRAQAREWRQAYEKRQQRLEKEQRVRDAARQAKQAAAVTTTAGAVNPKSLMVAAALARTNLKKHEKKLDAARAAGESTTALELTLGELQERVREAETALAAAQSVNG